MTTPPCDWCDQPSVTSGRKWGSDPSYPHGGELRVFACPAHVETMTRALSAAPSKAGREAAAPPKGPDSLRMFDPMKFDPTDRRGP